MGGETDVFHSAEGFQAFAWTMFCIQLGLTSYHMLANWAHEPNRRKTFEPSITETKPSVQSQSKGGGTGSKTAMRCGVKLTPNNTSTAFMVLVLLELYFQTWYTALYLDFIKDSGNGDWEGCENVTTFMYSCNILSKIPLYWFVMLRVRVTEDRFTPRQKLIARFLPWWFMSGFLAVFCMTFFVDNGTTTETGCADEVTTDFGVQAMGFLFGLVDGSTQMIAIFLFIWPMINMLRERERTAVTNAASKGRSILRVESDLDEVFRLVRRITLWTLVMTVSTMVASVYYIATQTTWLFTVDAVVNSFCVNRQYVRRSRLADKLQARLGHVALCVWCLGLCGARHDEEEREAASAVDVATRAEPSALDEARAPTSDDVEISAADEQDAGL